MSPSKHPDRDLAAASARLILSYLAGSRLVWSAQRPMLPGYYWLRDYGRNQRPYVVEVLQDWSLKDVPLVVQEHIPESTGVQYLLDASYDRCWWSGPLPLPDDR